MKTQHNSPCHFTRKIAALLTAAGIFTPIVSQAASGSWNLDAAGNWGTASNWLTGAVPGTVAGDVINFNNALTQARTITINTTSRQMGDLNIGSSAAFAFTLAASGGAALQLDGADATDATVNFTANANTITAPITLVDNGVFRSNIASVQRLDGNISGAGKSVTYNNDTNGTLNAASSGNGLFTITGANTYTGGTTISDVRVTIQTSNVALGAAGSAVTIQNGGQVFNSSGLTAINYAFNIAGNGWVEATGQFGALRLDSGAIVTGTVAMSANAAIGSNSGTGTVNGVVSGVGFTLSKVGAGILVLAGANTYTGGTTITSGVLQLNNNAGAGTGTITIAAAAAAANRLLLNGGVTIANPVSFGATTGTASLGRIQQTGIGQGRVNGAITITGAPSTGGDFVGGNAVGNELVLGGAITSSVAISQRDGRVIYMGGGAGYTSLSVTNTALVGATNGISTAASVALGGSQSAALDLNGFDQSLAGLQFGNATLANSFVAVTTLGVRALTLTGDITSVSNVGQTVTHTMHATAGGALKVGASARTITLTDTNAADDLQIHGAAINGAGGILKSGAGALALNGVTIEGPLVVNVGTLATGAGAQVGSITAPSLTFAAGTTLRMKAGASGDIITGGVVATAGTMVRLNQIGGILANGTYALVNYTGTAPTIGAGGFTLAPVGHSTSTLVDTGTAIALNVAGNDKVIWGGTTSAWATAATGNWKLATPLTATDYVESDDVVFQDAPTGSAVAIATNVTPSNVAFTNTIATAYTVSGAGGIIGPTGVTKTGNGSVTLSTPNYYTGTTTISAGTLSLAGSLNGSSVVVAAGATFTATGAMTGAGVGLTNSGTSTLSGANTYTGATSVLAGTLNLTAGTIGGIPTGSSVVVGSNITISNGATLAQSGGTITGAGIGLTVASGGTFNQTAGVFAGANNTLVTSGTTTLAGVNTFTGDVTLSGGTLTVSWAGGATTGNLGGSNNSAAFSKSVFITNNATFKDTVTYNDNVGTATTNLQVVFHIGTGGGTFETPTGTTMTLDENSAAGNANNAAQLQGAGNLTKTGDGTLSLGNGTSNFGTFTGQIFVNGGTLTTGTTSSNPFGTPAAGTTIASGATLDVKAAAIGAEPLTISGTGFGGIGALISSATGGAASGPIALAANSRIGGAAALALSGVISGAGFGLEKVGAGTTTLSNPANTYTGATTINAGVLRVTGSISGSAVTVDGATAILGGGGTTGAVTLLNGGSVNPGASPGILSTGAFTMNTGTTLNLEVDTTTPVTGYDQLNVTGAVNLGSGTLSLSGAYLTTPSVTNDLFFVVLNDGADAITGTFSGVADGSHVYAANGQDYLISYFADAGTSSFTGGNDVALMAVPEPASVTLMLGGLAMIAGARRRRQQS